MNTRAPIASLAAPDADVVSVLHEIRDLLRELVERQPLRRGARDGADLALMPAIVAVVGHNVPFTARDLFRASNPQLRDTLLAADITSTRELAQLLHHLEGPIGDCRLDRVRRGRHGVVWTLATG